MKFIRPYSITIPRLSPSAAAVPAMLTALLIAASCVRSDDFEECEFPLRLQFSYTFNRENRDLLMEEIPTISLRLFDAETGKFVKKTDLSINELDSTATYVWKAPPGKYSLVSWGGIQTRYLLSEGQTLDQHFLTLPTGEDGYISHRQEHLWHNISTGINIDGDLSPVFPIELRKISNDITVTINSSDGKPFEQPVSSSINAANGHYSPHGTIHPEATSITYTPFATGEPTRLTHSYTTLGLSRSDGSKLTVAYGDQNIFDGSLTELIARQPDIDFDLDDDFHLDFDLKASGDNSASVSISVNGWHIVEYDVTLF